MTIRLDLVNSMLSTTGTAQLTAEDSAHPNYITASIALDDVLEEFNSRDLWFNVNIRELAPDVDGRIVVPSNALSCDPTDGSLSYAIRGQYLFDMDNYTNVISETVECRIVTEVSLEDMPPIALQFIRAAARLQYFLDQDGGGTKLQMYVKAFERKELELIALNIKHQDINFFGGSSYANYMTRRTSTSNPTTRIQ